MQYRTYQFIKLRYTTEMYIKKLGYLSIHDWILNFFNKSSFVFKSL